jgi:multiple antibiotic resistance protein
MSDLFSFAATAFLALFFIVDPFGTIPIFVSITSRDSAQKRARTALKASAIAFLLLVFFAVFGSIVFRVFGITLSAFKIAGGILLLLTSIDMLRAQPARTRSSPEETEEIDDMAIVPMAIPLLAGPGAIATVMVLSARGKNWIYLILVIGAIALTCTITYVLLRLAGHVNRLLGKGGITVIERIIGLLLAAIAVQFIVDGTAELLSHLAHNSL